MNKIAQINFSTTHYSYIVFYFNNNYFRIYFLYSKLLQHLVCMMFLYGLPPFRYCVIHNVDSFESFTKPSIAKNQTVKIFTKQKREPILRSVLDTHFAIFATNFVRKIARCMCVKTNGKWLVLGGCFFFVVVRWWYLWRSERNNRQRKIILMSDVRWFLVVGRTSNVVEYFCEDDRIANQRWNWVINYWNGLPTECFGHYCGRQTIRMWTQLEFLFKVIIIIV